MNPTLAVALIIAAFAVFLFVLGALSERVAEKMEDQMTNVKMRLTDRVHLVAEFSDMGAVTVCGGTLPWELYIETDKRTTCRDCRDIAREIGAPDAAH